MSKSFISRATFMTAAILVALLAVTSKFASMQVVASTMIAVLVACFLLWRNNGRKLELRSKAPKKTSSALIWLLALFTASAGAAFVQAMYEKWDIGDTIGLGVFMLFAGFTIFELLRQSRTKDAK